MLIAASQLAPRCRSAATRAVIDGRCPRRRRRLWTLVGRVGLLVTEALLWFVGAGCGRRPWRGADIRKDLYARLQSADFLPRQLQSGQLLSRVMND
jgi:hypothetical protein